MRVIVLLVGLWERVIVAIYQIGEASWWGAIADIVVFGCSAR
jgi:hypothetical protein